MQYFKFISHCSCSPVLDSLGINQLLELLLLSDQEMVLMSVSLGRDSVVSWAVGSGLLFRDSSNVPGATFCPSTTGTGKLVGAVVTWRGGEE